MEPEQPLPFATQRSAEPAYALAMWTTLPWWLRAVLAASGLFLITLLVVARGLEPSPRGFGTHQQLGLPECRFLSMFGRRCPACGMTTSWAYLVRGDLVSSLSVNAGGTLLGILSLVTGPWLLVSGLRGRWVGRPPHEMVVVTISVCVALVVVTDWVLRLCFV